MTQQYHLIFFSITPEATAINWTPVIILFIMIYESIFRSMHCQYLEQRALTGVRL